MAQEIFKICHLKDNKIYKIDVFNGDTEYIGQNIKDIYTSDQNILNNFFDEEEKPRQNYFLSRNSLNARQTRVSYF